MKKEFLFNFKDPRSQEKEYKYFPHAIYHQENKYIEYLEKLKNKNNKKKEGK